MGPDKSCGYAMTAKWRFPTRGYCTIECDLSAWGATGFLKAKLPICKVIHKEGYGKKGRVCLGRTEEWEHVFFKTRDCGQG